MRSLTSTPFLLKLSAWLFAFACVGCVSLSIEQAKNNYRENRDYSSLELLSRSLTVSMQRSAVENLLGEPDYCPFEGQCYYSSDRMEAINDEFEGVMSLVVEYRDTSGTVTSTLQSFSFLPVGE